MEEVSVKKKLKLKKKTVLFLVLGIIVLGIFISPFLFIKINLVGDGTITVNYGDKYKEPGYLAYLGRKNVTSDVKVSSDIKSSLGTYKVTYKYKFLFYNIVRKRVVKVEDVVGPKIELVGDKELELTINTEYVELGFKAIDNKDGDVTSSVKIENKIDNTKLGTYEVIYTVSDSSGNKSKAIRKVKVERLRPTQMSIQEFSLDGWYEETKLKETQDYGDEYYNKIVMVGDSNTMNMYSSGYIKGTNAWAIPCLHAQSMYEGDINLYGYGKKMNLLEAVSQYKPEYMIINLGVFSTAWIGQDAFLEYSKKVIEGIKERSPDTKIMLISLYPILSGNNINKFDQAIINKYNFMILELAKEYDLKYLDAEVALKDAEGYGRDDYYFDDHYHLNNSGYRALKNYIRTHAWED